MHELLDDKRRIRDIDQNNMLSALQNFPEAIRDTIIQVEKKDLELLDFKNISNIISIGVGGSGVSGEILKDWVQDSITIPLEISKSYSLPRYANENTLVFSVSYSGNTVETINAMRESIKKQCKIIAITSGGVLEEISKENNFLVIKIPKGLQPRASLPNLFFSMAGIMHKLGLITDLWNEVEETLRVLDDLNERLKPEVEVNSNEAKQLAINLKGKIPFVYGSPLLKGASYRLSTQFQENSKIPAGSGFFPEVFHNAIMSTESTNSILNMTCGIILKDKYSSIKMRKKIKEFEKLLKEKMPVYAITSRGKGSLSRILSTLYIGDYVSTYLGILYGKNPSSTKSINRIKTCE